ncbi:MAG: translation elongation factor Ts [Candidatus Levybacteria bacterium]|nr:translation elongation factor Ts [Candidatus Levybacteria bacterium]
MASANIELLKKLRNETSAGIADCRKALEETDNNYEKAKEWLKAKGLEKAEKKGDREVGQGLVESYVHQTGRVAALVEILCETDFVARTDEFKLLAKEVAMQVASMNPKDVDALLKQDYIRDNSLTIEKLIKQTIGKLGENIVVKKISRIAIGE